MTGKFAFFFLVIFACFQNNQTANAQQVDEVLQVLGQRNQLASDQLVAKQIESIDISAQLPQSSVAELLASSASISFNGQGGLLQSYSLRGFSRSRIRTEVDGVPIITDRRAGNSLSFVPSELLENIQVQKGPSSTLYGSEAIGGVVSFQSRNFNTNEISFSGQSNDDLAAMALHLGGKQWQTSVVYRHAEQASAANSQALNTGFEQLAGLVKYKFDWQNYQLALLWLPSVGRDIGKSAKYYPKQRISDYPEEIHNLTKLSLSEHNRWQLDLYHHYQNWDSNTSRLGERQNITQYQAHTLGGSLIGLTHWLGGTGRTGIDWISRKGVSISETEYNFLGQVNFSDKFVDAGQDNLALFSDLHWQFSMLQLSAGVRYDFIRQQQHPDNTQSTEQQVNTNIVMNIPLAEQTNIQFDVATGFRFPTLSERYFQGNTPRGQVLGNKQLSPETSRGAQIKFNHQLNDELQFSVEGYYYQLDDYIQRYQLSSDITSYRNLASATIYGFEARTYWYPLDHFSHQLSYQWQQGEDRASNQLDDLVPEKVLWQMSYQNSDFVLTNQFEYQFSRSSFGSSEQSLKSHFLWQVSAAYQISSQLHFSIYGKNLTNKEYLTSADEDAPFAFGRVIGIKLYWQW